MYKWVYCGWERGGGDSFYLCFKNEFPALWIKLLSSKLHRGMVESSNNQLDSYVHHMHVPNCRNNEILQGRWKTECNSCCVYLIWLIAKKNIMHNLCMLNDFKCYSDYLWQRVHSFTTVNNEKIWKTSIFPLQIEDRLKICRV